MPPIPASNQPTIPSAVGTPTQLTDLTDGRSLVPSPLACIITPPADCNGHGTIQQCTCICQSGFANDFTVRIVTFEIKYLLGLRVDIVALSIIFEKLSHFHANHAQNLVSPSWCASNSSAAQGQSSGTRSVDLNKQGTVSLYPPASEMNGTQWGARVTGEQVIMIVILKEIQSTLYNHEFYVNSFTSFAFMQA